MQAPAMSEEKPPVSSRPIFVVSDGTGDTGAAVAKAALAQFQVDCRLRRFGGIRQPSLARRVVADALVLFTIVDRRGLFEQRLRDPAVDEREQEKRADAFRLGNHAARE